MPLGPPVRRDFAVTAPQYRPPPIAADAHSLRPFTRLDSLLITVLNGLSAGLLLFMLGAGLTLIFSMMGVLNFAHAGFYMLGAYLGYALAQRLGFWPALALAPLAVGLLGAWFQRVVLRRVHRHGHASELLVTFGLSFVIVEAVKLLWGLSPVPFAPPALLQGPAFTLVPSAGGGIGWVWGAAPAALCAAACTSFPATRLFIMAVALCMLLALWLLLRFTRTGLVIRAAQTHPDMVEALGHDLPRVFMLVFAGGCGLAGLAGVIGGMTFVTEPAMAGAVGTLLFVVVVVGGMGSLAGAFVASLLIGLLQTLPLAVDRSLLDLWCALDGGCARGDLAPAWLHPVLEITLAQAAPVLPYLLLVAVLVWRPRGLLGPRES